MPNDQTTHSTSEPDSGALRTRLRAGKPIIFDASSPPDTRRVHAAWIAEAIAEGVPISLEHAFIAGRLDLHEQSATAKVRFFKCSFEAAVDLSYADFESAFWAVSCDFSAGINLDSVRFGSDAWLENCKLAPMEGLDKVYLNDAEFVGVLNAKGLVCKGAFSAQRARFQSAAFFDSAVFEGQADFTAARVSGDVYFDKATFAKPATFWQARITGQLGFTEACFARRAHLELARAVCDGGLLMPKATLFGALLADGARFGYAVLDGATALRGVTLSGVTLAGNLSAVGARLGKRFIFDIRNARIDGQLLLTRADLRAGARFDDATFGTLSAAHTVFGKNATFNRVKAKAIDLTEAQFDGGCSFDAAHVSGVLDAPKTRFAHGLRAHDAHLGDLFLAEAKSFAKLDLPRIVVTRSVFIDQASLRSSANGDGVALELGGAKIGAIAWFDKTVIRGGVIAIGLRVEMQMSWNQVVVQGAVDFYEMEVLRGAFFRHARFRNSCNMDRAIFHGETFFSSMRVSGAFVLRNSRVNLLNCAPDRQWAAARNLAIRPFRLRASANFEFTQFGTALFTGSRFEGPTSFASVKFDGSAGFDDVTFGATFKAVGASFAHKPTFFTTFVEYADFSQASFSRGADFGGSRFRGGAGFQQVHCDGDLRFPSLGFVTATGTGTTSLELRDAVFSTLSFVDGARFAAEETRLPERIDLRGCRYERIDVMDPLSLVMVDRRRSRLSTGYDRQTFAQLENTLRDAGAESEAEKIYIAGRRLETTGLRGVRKLGYRLWDLFSKYGVSGLRPLILGLVIVAAGGLFFRQPGAVEHKEAALREAGPPAVTSVDALMVSFAQFMPIALPVKDHLRPAPEPVAVSALPGRPAMQINPVLVATVLQILGWVIVPIGLAVVSGILMRKSR